MTKARFRLVLVLSLVLGVLGVTVALAGGGRLPPLLQDYLQQRADADVTTTDLVLLIMFLPMCAAYLASFIGMLRFSRWSRPWTVGSSVVGLAGLPFFGPTVEPGLATALHYLSSMFFGAAVALAYWSPAAAWFEIGRSPSATEPQA